MTKYEAPERRFKSWKTLERKPAYDCKAGWLRVEEHRVGLPDGTVIEQWPWVASPDFVLVLGVTPEQTFMVFEQTKYAVDVMLNQDTLAPVGGYLEPDEDPKEAALREFQEETGYQSPTLIHLSSTVVDGNRGAGMGHLYLALDATFTETIDSDDLEEQNLMFLTRSELEKALDEDQFKVSVWALLVALALRYLDRKAT